MPTPLIREKWPLGWCPSNDDTGGSPEGLLRADNLILDELGALTLARGFKNINASQFPGFPHSIYSTPINNVKHRFVGLSTGQILHAPDGENFSDEILSGGNPARARFTDVLGSVFCSSGASRKKFDGTNKWNWGLESPLSPVSATPNSQQFYDVSGADGGGSFSQWEMVEGANFSGSNGAHVDTDPDTFRCVVGIKQGANWRAYPGGGIGLDSDIFSFRVRLGDASRCDRIRVEIGLGSVGDLKDMPDYYWFEWQHDVDQTEFLEGTDTFTTLQAKLSEFTRQGDNTELNWSTVGAIRVTMIFTDVSADNLVERFQLSGSTNGPLNGDIQYVQVNVRDNGIYQGKSAASPQFVKPINVINASVELTPQIPGDPQVNQIWLFRQGGILENYLRIGVIDLTNGGYIDSAGNYQAFSGTVTDICPAEKAQDLNIPANLNLLSIRDLEDEFISIIEGAYFERVIIATTKEILLSDRLNPEAIDNRFRLSVSGDKTEAILWITKISDTVLMVGTTKNRYELTGTLLDNPDGTLVGNIRPLGERHPPLGLEYALDSGNVIYLAEDGWRITSGGPSSLLSKQLDLLFKNRNRYGVAPVQLVPNALVDYPVAVYKGQIWTSNPLTDGARQTFVYDLTLQSWQYRECNPISLFVESDGTLLGGFGNPNDYYLKTLDVGTSIDTQGVTEVGQRIYLQTVYDHNGQPRNRKDAFTVKLLIDTGGEDVNVYLSGDSGGFAKIATVNTDYLRPVFIDIWDQFTDHFGLGFRYALKITSDGFNLKTFRLTQFIIEYDPRPELQTTLRILPTNLGSFSRKRATNFAFVCDTLGFQCTFQPIIDGAEVGSPLTFSNIGKKTIIYYFTSETIGTDFGGIIKAVRRTEEPVDADNRGAFEYYGPNLDEIVSEKLPTPVKFLKIPANDYGVPNRKRHSSYKFQINTNGKDVLFTPILDGVALASATFNTSEKRTVEYFFTTDTAAIDIGGTLESLEDTPFEFYGVIVPQKIEVLPPRLKEFYIPETNYGIAAKKRIRTMPMEINTNGSLVNFTPIVDGVRFPATSISTPTRKTAFHYFTTDVFGIDFAAEITGEAPFEFYDLLKPETVEVLPVGKKFDQVGPVHFARVGKLIGFRLRIIAGGTSIPWTIYAEDERIGQGLITTVPNVDDVYEVEYITKGRIAVITRMELGPVADPFHRYYVEFKVNYGGNSSEIKLVRFTDAFAMSQR